MGILLQIREKYPSLKKARRKIAEYVLESPEKCSFYSLSELSKQTGTAEVTILNFCHALGCRNYLDFKQGLQDELMERIGTQARIRMTHSTCKNESDLYRNVIQSTHQMINATFAKNDAAAIQQFAEKLVTFKHLFIVAHNVTQAPALTFLSRLHYQGLDAHYLDVQNSEAVFAQLTMWPVEDCLLVAFGISPIGKSTIGIGDFCKKLGMEIISITDKETSQIAQDSSLSLICNVRVKGVYNSTTTIFALLDVLTVFLSAELDKLPSRTGRNSQELEELRRQFVDYNTLL